MATLSNMFPGARFIHIVRDPFIMFLPQSGSGIRYITSGNAAIDSEKNTEEYVFKCFDTMYSAFERDRVKPKEGQLHEIHYEELVADHVASMKRYYEKLALEV